MVEDKANPTEGPHRPQHREQTGAACSQRWTEWIIIQIFLLGDNSHTHLWQRVQQEILSSHIPLHLAFNNTMASDAVGRSIIQLAENQSHSLDFILVGQQSQMDAYREMTTFQPGKGGQCSVCRYWCIWWRRPLKIWRLVWGHRGTSLPIWLTGIYEKSWWRSQLEPSERHSPWWMPPGLMMMSSPSLWQDFSLMSTMNRAREELKDLKKLPGQPISSYMYKYGRIHFLATGNQAHNERYPTAIMEFIKSLNPKVNEGH